MMKEAYFTPETIRRTSRQLLEAAQYPRSRDPVLLDPAGSALLVLDMQAYFLDPGSHAYVPSARATLPGLRSLVDAFTAHSRPVVFTRHQNTPRDAGGMSRWWGELLTPDHPLGEVVPELGSGAGLTVTKTQYDAFYLSPLEKLLHERAVRQVVIGGVMAHLCCETTARSAFVRGFEVFFLVDGTASYQERYHAGTLANLSHGFAELALVEDILQALEQADGSS